MITPEQRTELRDAIAEWLHDWSGRNLSLATEQGLEAVAPVVAHMLADARTSALKETGDVWQRGQWADVLIPHATSNPIANAQRVTEWLRARAAQAAPEVTS